LATFALDDHDRVGRAEYGHDLDDRARADGRRLPIGCGSRA
jgi:hypothetical protein